MCRLIQEVYFSISCAEFGCQFFFRANSWQNVVTEKVQLSQSTWNIGAIQTKLIKYVHLNITVISYYQSPIYLVMNKILKQTII